MINKKYIQEVQAFIRYGATQSRISYGDSNAINKLIDQLQDRSSNLQKDSDKYREYCIDLMTVLKKERKEKEKLLVQLLEVNDRVDRIILLQREEK